MALEPKVKTATHSKTLFTDASANPIVFYMRPCSERQFLKPLIEHGGGKVTSKSSPNCVKLAEKGSTVSSKDFFSTKFVEDCISQNKYLDVAAYSIAAGTLVRRDSDVSFSSDDSMSPAATIIRTESRDCKGRTKYTKEEDLAMINFLVTERRYRDATGIRVWKDMEALKVTDHSAESMNTRYRKVIIPNIERYKYDISSKWISLLTGNIHREKEPEFSVEALFNPKKLKRSERQKEKTDNVVDSPQKTAGTLTPKKQSKIDSCVNNNMVDLTNKSHTSLDTSLKCVNDESDNVSDRQLKRRLPDNQKTNPSDKQNQKHGKVEHSQEDLNNCEVDKSIGDRTLRRQNKLNESNQGTDERHSQASPAKGNSKLKSKEESSQNNTDNEGSQSLLGRTECFVVLDEDLGIEIKEQLIDNTKTKYSFKKRTSAINEVQKIATTTENETKTDEITECQPVKIVNRDQLSSKKSSEEENANIGKEKGGSIDNETNEGTDLEEGLDSFDKMLLGHVRRSPRKRVNVFDDSDNESEKKARCDDVQTVSKESWQKDYSNYKKKKQKEIRSADSTTLSAAADSSTKDIYSYHSESEPEEDDDIVKELRTNLRRLGRKFGLPTEYVRRLLFRNSGSIPRTISYIKYGPDSPWSPPWKDDDDKALNDPEELARLINKFGESDFRARFTWLGIEFEEIDPV